MKQSISDESESKQAYQSRYAINAARAARAANAQGFIDNRPETIMQRRLVDAIHSSSRIIAQNEMKESLYNSPRMVAQRKQYDSIVRSASQFTHKGGADAYSSANKPAIQLQKSPGLYQISESGNLRRNNEQHSVIRKLDQGELIRVIDKGHKVSSFKAGWVTNEHSWVLIEGEDEYTDEYGWVEDGKLGAPQNLLQNQFTEGDKLYGRHEARYTITRSSHPENDSVNKTKYPIIDDLNNMILHDETSGDPEFISYKEYLKKNKVNSSWAQERINRYCKQALVHNTNTDHTIHFMLDGIEPSIVLSETKNRRKDQPGVTGIELRALMRAAMRAKGLRGAKTDADNQDIDIARVKFYVNHLEVKAPWAADVNIKWGQLWRDYKEQKKGK